MHMCTWEGIIYMMGDEILQSQQNEITPVVFIPAPGGYATKIKEENRSLVSKLNDYKFPTRT